MQQAMPASIDITPQAALPAADDFEAVIQRAGFADQREIVTVYLGTCAKHFSKSINEVKAEICRNPDGFIKAFPTWVKSVEQQKEQQKQVKKPKKEDKKAEPAPDPAAAPAAKPEPEAEQPAPQGPALSHAPRTGERFGAAASLITCPNNGKQVDELDCVNKTCRNGCTHFI
jgi:hypothetical protein